MKRRWNDDDVDGRTTRVTSSSLSAPARSSEETAPTEVMTLAHPWLHDDAAATLTAIWDALTAGAGAVGTVRAAASVTDSAPVASDIADALLPLLQGPGSEVRNG